MPRAKPSQPRRITGFQAYGRRLFYPFSEGSGATVRDFARRNHGTPSGTAVWAAGPFGRCVDFTSGGTGILDCGSDTSLDDLGPLTYAAWIFPRTTGEGPNAGRIFEKGGNTGTGPAFTMNGANPYTLRFFRDFTTTDLVTTSTAITMPVGEWAHVAVTWDGGTATSGVKFYHNGRLAPAASGTAGVGTPVSDAGNNQLIGNRPDGARAFDGLIDAPGIWDRVLLQAAIAAIVVDSWAGVRPAVARDAYLGRAPSDGAAWLYFRDVES